MPKKQKIVFENRKLRKKTVTKHTLRFQGYFGHFMGFGGTLVIFRFRRYFGHFLGFGGILVILEIFGIILDVKGYIGNFGRLGVFASF